MRLRRIDILGFKSFRDRMTLEFSEGMTAIVGPNGCGKSNVVDAMKWAMGDMSPKSLRGQAMEDVIFAGSENARPMGMAEVTLVFENDGSVGEWDDSIPREFRDVAEISVTRRLHRSGDSEYLINKVQCRLMDIQNLLSGTGVGKQGYSIIEQNQVGFIVSSRPSERRLLIEEASGITRYKAQRERTMKRLEKAEENLQRADDILMEVTRQIRTLERQAQRATQYRRLTEELHLLELSVLIRKWDELALRQSRLTKELEAQEAVLLNSTAALNSQEVALIEIREQAQVFEKQHREATELFYKVETQLNLLKSRSEHAAESLRDAYQRLETSRREMVSQADRRNRMTQELSNVKNELEGTTNVAVVDEDVLEREGRLKAAREALVLGERDAHEVKSSLERTRADYHRLVDRRGWLKAQLEEMASREADIDRQLSVGEAELLQWSTRLEECLQTGEQLHEQLREAEKLTQRSEQAKLEGNDAEKIAAKRVDDTRRSFVERQARLESLEAMRGSGEGFGEGVRQVMTWARREAKTEILGPIAELIEVPESLQVWVGRWLGDELQHIVCTSPLVAFEAAKKVKKGRVTFLIAPDFDVVRWTSALTSRWEFLPEGASFLEPDGGQILAFDEGILVSHERVVAGQAESEGASAMKRNTVIRSLEVEVADLRAGLAAAEKDLESAQQHRAQCHAAWDAARLGRDRVSLEVRESIRKTEEARRENERAQKSLERTRGQLLPMLRRREDASAELEEMASREADLLRLREESQAQSAIAEERVVELRRSVERWHLELTERRVEQAQVRERRRSLEESVNRLERAIASAESLEERYGRDAEDLELRITNLTSQLDGSETQTVELAQSLEVARKRVEELRQAVAQNTAKMQVDEAALKAKREAVDAARQAFQAIQVSQKEVAFAQTHVDEQLLDLFGCDVEVARTRIAQLELPEDERLSRRDYLKRRIESMGPVNAMAEQEYTEALERERFLTEQKDDLVRSVSDLRKAIAEMDRESRKRFRETFDAVDAQFREIFPRLFRGGHARLLLTDPNDMLTTGVDIEVCPPGKRLQNVSLLSGGEKALTAVSLIFSIFMLKPTPFSILDEVDAPLDEANVGRFAQMVREMSATSQMIVITHSRRTMEAAELLYGVTMELPGISKIVSVRLSEADNVLAL